MKDNAFSQDLIVRYLLGDLPAEEQIEIEDRAFEDRQYLRDVLAVEDDLIDEYVRGELSDSERRQFEGRFLASAERRRKVEFARALASVAPEFAVREKGARSAATPVPAGWQSALSAFFQRLGPAARFSLAAASLLIVIGGSWLVAESVRLRAGLRAEQRAREQREEILQQQIEDARARNEDLAAQLRREQEQTERSRELARELQRELEGSMTQPSPSTVVSLALWPGISRSGSARPKLIVPQSARRVRLQIGIEPEEQYENFRVELRAQGGQQAWAEDNLPARRVRAGRAVVLNLPASALKAGEYELALKGMTDDRRGEEIGYYYFDVLKK